METIVSFPKEIAARFTPLEDLGSGVFGDTFLLLENATKAWFILKVQSMDTINEAKLLSGLLHSGLPVYDAAIEHEDKRYVLRKYVHGETLDEYMRQSADENQLMDILIQLCDILIYLHVRSIIHRDIKPSNIIIDENGTVSLIDFGISRKYHEDADTDTTFFGTSRFAPPEQYGFAQTDPRSDIYSFGVVMRYLFMGNTERNKKIPIAAIDKIAAKCTSLAPEARFQNAAALKKALLNYRHRVKRRLLAAAASVVFLCIFIYAGFTAYNRANTADGILPVLEISDHEFIEFLEAEWPGTLHLSRSGSGASYEFVEGRGLRIYERENNWDAVDFYVTSLAVGEYLLVAEVSADEPTNFCLNTVNEPWHRLINPVTDALSATLEYDLTIVNVNGVNMAVAYSLNQSTFSYQSQIRIQTPNQYAPVHNDYYIESIRVYAKP